MIRSITKGDKVNVRNLQANFRSDQKETFYGMPEAAFVKYFTSSLEKKKDKNKRKKRRIRQG